MSVATKTESKVFYDNATIPSLISLSPPPGRMIVVEVFQDVDKTKHSVGWSDVIGLLCVLKTDYSKKREGTRTPSHTEVNHEEMMEQGWFTEWHPYYAVYPVALGGEYHLLSVLDGGVLDECGNRVGRRVVACHWAPEDDRSNAIRIGKDIVANRHSDGTGWADLEEKESHP